MSGVQLIVTPLTLSFQAPILHTQKRLIALLNPSDKVMIYRVHISNDTDYSADPSTGRVEPFDTTEVALTLTPVKETLPNCSIIVKSISEDLSDVEKEEKWNSMDVKIELDPTKTPRLRMQTHDLAQILEKHYQPLCTKCAQKLPKGTYSWSKRIKYFLMVFGVGFAAYLSYEALLILKSEPVF
ncbi:uncharacterized protein LOC108042705 [Drosophila rhopaloa]|uniref:Uncharacterized protein LOC108042705 n=1 Tax=Drosophila rhopaloa TaxID=1041015 RepID=A0A6P4ETX3_DRORH|nr:uncharacterized protein LOC108042705 [Drosophila rhopaloa]